MLAKTFNSWLADNGAIPRAWLEGRAPEDLHGLIAHTPVWLLPPVAVVAVLIGVWLVKELAEKTTKSARWIAQTVRHPRDAAKDLLAPATAL
jgi:hypothetical protein